MRFIVANYGPRHAGLLLAHLESVSLSHPKADVSVYWQDMPERLIGAIKAAFPKAQFVETRFDFAGDPLQRISSKVLCWTQAAEEHGGGDLVFADGDTLVHRDVSGFFAEDVVFTTKPERVPLNTGVILTRGTAAADFMRAWRDATLHILKTPVLFAQANDDKLPYGGTDQMSLFQMLGYRSGSKEYRIRCGERMVELHAAACSRLNETNSRPLSGAGEEICVIHYKAGWQQILLNGRPFSQWRPREASWEMLSYFLQTLSRALERIRAIGAGTFTPEDFGIRWPWYWQNGRFSSPAYTAWRLRAALERGWLLVRGKLKPGM